MQMNLNSTAVAGPMMTPGARAKDQCASSSRRRPAAIVRIQPARGDSWENVAWAFLALVALGALVVSFAF